MIYEANTDVNIRREPKIVEYKLGKQFITNRIGMISAGTQREIFSVLSNSKGETWGRVSEADSAGIAEWVCIQNLNRVFMKLVEASQEAPAATLEQRIFALETWARTKGFGA